MKTVYQYCLQYTSFMRTHDDGTMYTLIFIHLSWTYNLNFMNQQFLKMSRLYFSSMTLQSESSSTCQKERNILLEIFLCQSNLFLSIFSLFLALFSKTINFSWKKSRTIVKRASITTSLCSCAIQFKHICSKDIKTPIWCVWHQIDSNQKWFLERLYLMQCKLNLYFPLSRHGFFFLFHF